MFKVKNFWDKSDKTVYTVYGVRYTEHECVAYFLMYNKHSLTWEWVRADDYCPYED